MKWVKERHEYWWDYLLKRVWVPLINWNTRASRVAGRANYKMCQYNINYILQEQGNYDETICHEVCHVFAKRLMAASAWHDSLWKYLYNIVTKHNQPEEVKMIAELLKLQKKLS